jgi:ABC-type transport system substrate-binding protein
LAINEEQKIKLFYNGRGIVAHSPVPPGLAGYDENFKNPWKEFDVEKAKKLMAEAGFADGKGVPVIPYETSTGTEARQMAEDLQRSLAPLGIKLQINVNQFAELLEKIDQKKAMMWGIAWGADYPDAENFLQLLYGPNKVPGPNGSNFDHAEYNKLFEQMRYMLDSPERRKIISRMAQILVDEMPWVPSMHRVGYYLTQPWFKNYKPGYMGSSEAKFLRVDLERREQGVK